MNCIFCGNPVLKNSIEHIVPESMGNKTYILDLGSICEKCNNSFSNFESKALSRGILALARSMSGFATKKGKPAKGQSNQISFEGSHNYIENQIKIAGLDESNIKTRNPDGSIEVDIKDFDKSEVPISKLLLKIGMESLFHSQRKVFYSTNLNDLKDYLNKKTNSIWPFITISIRPFDFNSIPRFQDKQNLKKINCEILYKKTDEKTFLLYFKYSFLSYIINLANRDTEWIAEYREIDKLIGTYPENLINKQ